MSKPLYQRIYEKLKTEIRTGVYGEGDRLPTEKDFMEQFEVSRVTVQKAVNMLAEEGLVVRIIGKGTFVKSDRTLLPERSRFVVGLLFGPSPVYGLKFLNAFLDEIAKSGGMVIFFNTNNSKEEEDAAICELMKFGVDACVIQPVMSEEYSNAILRLVFSGTPVVLVDRNLQGLEASFVGSANAAGILSVLHRLYEQGHRVISYVTTGSRYTSTLEERVEGFNQFYVRNKLINPNCNLYLDCSYADYESGNESVLGPVRQKIRRHLAENPGITCLITSEYYLSLLVRESLSDLGMRIPEDVSLVTFDNICYYPDRSVNSILQNEPRMAKLAVEEIRKALRKTGEHSKILCDMEYVDAGSVRQLTAEETRRGDEIVRGVREKNSGESED